MPGMQKIPKETILAAVEKLGPCQPIDIRKELKMGDSFLIGALLSELVAEGKLAISKTRRGGGPFYYDPAKSERLEQISANLNEKDRRTYALLKEQKVMREDSQDPLVRVGLQNIHDFSRKLEVGGVTYWRHFLLPEADAAKIVKGEMSAALPEAVIPKEELRAEPRIPSKSATTDSGAQVSSPTVITPASSQPSVQQNIGPVPESPKIEKKERKKRAPTKKPVVQATLVQPQDLLSHDTLYERVQKFAVESNAQVMDPRIVKMNAELACMMIVEGAFGKLSHHVIALNKKKIAEKDITMALLAAKGTPLLVLSVEEIPARVMRSFADVPNLHVRKLPS
jgi:hypothetical protein